MLGHWNLLAGDFYLASQQKDFLQHHGFSSVVSNRSNDPGHYCFTSRDWQEHSSGCQNYSRVFSLSKLLNYTIRSHILPLVTSFMNSNLNYVCEKHNVWNSICNALATLVEHWPTLQLKTKQSLPNLEWYLSQHPYVTFTEVSENPIHREEK